MVRVYLRIADQHQNRLFTTANGISRTESEGADASWRSCHRQAAFGVLPHSELGEAAESTSSFSRSLGEDDCPPFTLFHFILRFWNHTFTCRHRKDISPLGKNRSVVGVREKRISLRLCS